MSVSKRSAGKSPAVSIKKSVYSMATTDGQSAEIVMYGDIYEQRPTDWWTDEPVEGNFILLDEFMSDLDQIAGCKEITIRMNSYGGDAGVSNTIHNRLRELSRAGAKLTCVVDGVAMSGGSLIMCACDTVKVNPSSLVMIHKCWSFIFGGYNADELREKAEQQDAWDKMQVEIYKRKCGLSETVIAHMMADTTYMTGREAVDKGFADELLEDAEPIDIAAFAVGHGLMVKGRKMRLAKGMCIPDSFLTVKPGDSTPDKTNTSQPVTTGSHEGGNEPMAKNVDELRQEYPDLVAQVEADAIAAGASDAISSAVQAERNRIEQIDEVAGLFDAAMVQEAKYGENPCSAQDLAYRAAQAAAAQGKSFLANLNADGNDSGADGVPAVPGPDDADDEGQDSTPEARMTRARANVSALLGKKEG